MKITDLEYIKQVTQLLKSNKLNRIKIKDGEMSIQLESYENSSVIIPSSTTVDTQPTSAPTNAEVKVTNDNYTEIKSPIVGVFYSSSTPDSPPLVSVGDTVKKGDVLCVIEAMKFFNEIIAEQDGTVAEICLKNGDVVEFGQTLFKLS